MKLNLTVEKTAYKLKVYAGTGATRVMLLSAPLPANEAQERILVQIAENYAKERIKTFN